MTRAITTRRQHFLPYRFDDHALVLRVERCVLDGTRDVTASYDAERSLLDLSSSRFKAVRLRLGVKVDAEVLASVFPRAEHASPPGQVAVTITCAATRVRRAVVLGTGALTAGVVQGELDLVRKDLHGTVELVPVLVRTSERSEDDDEFATTTGSRLATGRALEVRIDVGRTPRGEYLDIRYESFREQGPPQFPRPDAMYQLDCEGDAPVLWLNLDHSKICSVFDGTGMVGRVARVRDVLFAQISQAVWTRLFWRAARGVQRAGETVHDWEHAVLTRLLPRIYPEVPNHESRIEALRADLDGDADDLVLARLDGALQDLLEVAACATGLAEELS